MYAAAPAVGLRHAGAVFGRSIALLVIAGVLSACVAGEPLARTEDRMSAILTAADNGATIKLRVGGDAELRLPENATTGYRWTVDAIDGNLAELRDGEYLAGANAIGSGGEAQWTVHAKAVGTTIVKLKRWRHWEGERSVVERYEFTLQVVP